MKITLFTALAILATCPAIYAGGNHRAGENHRGRRSVQVTTHQNTRQKTWQNTRVNLHATGGGARVGGSRAVVHGGVAHINTATNGQAVVRGSGGGGVRDGTGEGGTYTGPGAIGPRLTVATPEGVTPTTVYVDGHQVDFVVSIASALNHDDWSTVCAFTQNGFVNYFGHRYSSNAYIIDCISSDTNTYSGVYFPDSFTRQVSQEYSTNWYGPMIYDAVNLYILKQDDHGAVTQYLVRFTVGYTVQDDNIVTIYALTSQSLVN
jgi:hypothetical protein